ncbi:heterokaryon incompatibility protein [Fusarium langsethiae]|uniref:Heterokaryon incompatibility protein n=1 Tax=Fusarium langsethiae TaxID=179993 RepID=A0A0N0V4U2_FUSLA|nr:heterokaryon incompatibility protein [Fusarium langsethiae]
MTDAPQVEYHTPDWVTSCETCKAVWQRLTNGDTFKHTINLGSYKEALPAQCPHFKPIVEALYEYSKDENGNDMSREVRIEFGTQGYAINLDETVDDCGFHWNLALVEDDSVPHHPGTARILGHEWADLAVLNTWKDTCLSSHGASCQNPLKIWHTRPAWLIDVEQKCLVPGNVQGNYVALSYTYGNHIGRLVDASILDMLQVPDALESPTLSEYVSPIIRNAIFLTTAIGERYLWADAICITHEDWESTARQLTLMGAIYANAIVTIIAADGDSLTGLTGIKGISAARQLKQSIIPFGDQKLLRMENFGLEAEYWLPYYERGWIYQEMRMSTRKIVFHEEQLHWMCQCSVWHEESAQKAQIERTPSSLVTIDSSMMILFAGFFDWSVFSLLVTRYNDMTFRYDEDALPAISGLFSILSRRFEGGFLYGIPEMMFERGLGWKPWLDSTNLERRVRSSRPQDTQLKPSGLPSWSWIGWSGNVDPGYNEATLMARGFDGLEETTPITEWYTSHSPTDPPELWRRIRSAWYEDRKSYKDFTKPSPPGWTRHKAPDKSTWNDGPHLFPDGCNEYFFKHDSMPVDEPGSEEGRGWYYPFPIKEVNESTLPDMPEQTEYLFSKTNKARLWGVQKNGEGKDALLCNSQKQEIGFLNLVNDYYRARFPKTLTDGEGGILVDLVAVCKVRTYSRTQDEVTKIWDKTLTTKDTYLVLWVEWKDGIAYRLASGHVQVNRWDELDLESISLILG